MRAMAVAVLAFVPALAAAQKTERDTTAVRDSTVASPAASAAEGKAARFADAEHRVRQLLRDPESARFQGLYEGFDAKNNIVVVCGEVNAKNGFGGYTGFVPFYSSFDKTEIGGNAAGFFFPRRFNERCRR